MSEHAHTVEPWLTVEDAERILGFDANWIYARAASGQLPSYLIGRQRRFRASELEAFMQQFAQGKMGTVTSINERRR